MTVYVDLLFGLNTMLNFLFLRGSAAIGGSTAKFWRLLGAAAMGGLDGIVFGGGIGRKSDTVRAMSLAGLEFLGVQLDESKNANAGGGDDISIDGSPVRIFVVDTNEEIVVARKAKALLEQ